ncbi:MAG: HAD-IB family hydrolase [Thiohalomonadaceae bacterium]
MTARPIVAVFDFDGTITYRDTLLPFLRRLHGWGGVLRGALPLLPTLGGFALRLVPRDVAKERVLIRFLTGLSEAELRRLGADYAQQDIPRQVRPQALARLAWHRRQGHRCVVVSASIEHYVAPWARAAGFDDVLATRLAVDDAGRVSGRYDGANCYGAEKVRRLQQLLGTAADVEIYAYGDSRGDRELLALADHAYYRTMPGEGDGA